MKKFNTLALGLIILMQSLMMNVSASNHANSEEKSNDNNHTSKILKKFSIPITALVAIAGGGGYAYYKYQHRPRKIYITGDVTKEKTENALNEVNKLLKEKHNCILIFKNATVKEGAFESKDFNCDVLFTESCMIEAGACNQTRFLGNFEINGNISDNSSFRGAFMYKNVVVSGKVSANLFKGAVALAKEFGTKYKLPGKPKILYNKDNSNEVREYLEQYF